jgi:multidrug efflux system membrane fusion protein
MTMDQPTDLPPHADRATAPAPMPGTVRRRSRIRWIVWLILILLVAVIAYALLHHAKPVAPTGRGGHRHAAAGATGDAAPQPVSVTKAVTGDMPVVLTELGTVTPIATITVQSQISGYLLQVDFTEGQHVHRGDQLALVDPRLYQATLTQYEGNLIRDQALLKQAQSDNARYQLLLSQKSIASQTAQNQQYVVGQYEGAVRTDQGQIASAKQNIAYCSIRSPIDGRVGLRQVDAGNYISSSLTNGLVVVTQIQPISVIFSVPETNIDEVESQLRSGQPLTVDAYDRTNTTRIASGVVLTLDNTIDTSTGTVRVRASFPNTDSALFPNQFVNVRVNLKVLHNVVLVPTAAIQVGPQGNFVYLVKPDDTVAVTPVKTGTTGTTDVVVTQGLSAGDTVVTDGTDRLRSGAKITIPGPAKPAAQPDGQHAGQPGGRHHRTNG